MTFHRSPQVLLLLVLLSSPGKAAVLEVPQRIVLEPTLSTMIDPSPDDLVQLGDQLYFTAYDRRYGRELWTTEGSGTEVRRVADLCPGSCGSDPDHFELLGDRLVFTAKDGGGPALYSLRDGRIELVARPPGEVADTQVFGGRVFVAVTSPASKVRLFTTSGIAGDWHLFEDLCTGPTPPYCFAPELFVHGGALYYLRQGALRKASANGQVASLRALDRADRFESLSASLFLFRGCAEELPDTCRLFASDGSGSGTLPVNSNPDDKTTVDPDGLQAWNGLIYFTNGREIVRTDGTAGGTRVARELSPQAGLRAAILATTPTRLFYYRFVASDQRELRAHSSDGSDILILGPTDASLRTIGRLDDKVLFANGDRFVFTDGAGAALFLDGWELKNYGRVGAQLGDKLYVSATRSGYSSQLWRFDSLGNASLVLGASPEAQATSGSPLRWGQTPCWP